MAIRVTHPSFNAMTRFTYHASQEQFTPSDLLGLVQQAERAGFDGAFTSDHAHPWSETQGQCGFAWSWLGAAMARTTRLTFGTISVPGGWRYSPAILAQAVGTLGQMFPGGIIDAFRDEAGARPIHLKVDIAWAPTIEEARREAHAQWRFNALGGAVNWDIRPPADFDCATRFVRTDDLDGSVFLVTDPAALADWLAARVALGVETINIHNVGRNQAAFLDMAGQHLLPALRG